MNISQDQLKAFFEVTRFNSFTKAAEYLAITQSALSHRIRNLESELETTLFVRASNGIRLTEAGTKLLQFCRIQVQLEDEFFNDLKPNAQSGLKGTLRIGGASTLMWPLVAPALGPFIRKNPEIQLEMMVRELNELPQLLQTGQVDIIITCGKPNRHQFEEIYLGDEVNVLVESRKFSKIPNIFLDHHPDDQTTIEYLMSRGKVVKNLKRIYMDDIFGILIGLEEGLGKAVIPLHMLKSNTNLKPAKGSSPVRQSIHLCFMKQSFYSKLHLATLEILKEKIPKLIE